MDSERMTVERMEPLDLDGVAGRTDSRAPGNGGLPRWARSALGALLLCAMVAGPVSAQEASSEDWDLAGAVIKALRGGDGRTLGELTDFPGRLDEGVARGDARRAWDDMDDLDRLLTTGETIDAWLAAAPRHFESGALYNIEVLDDPDAGWGPVPDRRITQTVVKAARSGQLLDLIVVATPDGRLLDLQFGETYTPDHNPLGEQGLQPEGRPELGEQRIQWPAGLDEFDRDEVAELVDELLVTERPPDRRALVESLHRNPRAAVAGLLERVLEMNEAGSPDAVRQRTLMDALETITGRSSSFVAVARFGEDEGSLDAMNAADLASWLRWHERHGATFVAAAVQNPLVPTHGERPVTVADDDKGGDTARAKTRPPANSGRPGPKKPITIKRPPKPTAKPAPEPETGDDGGSAPAVTIRKPPKKRAPRALLKDESAALEILWGDRAVTAGEVAQDIPAPVRRLLDAWAADIVALDLRVCLSGNPDHVVMGRASDELLIDAAKRMDDAWEILDPVLPPLVKRTARPTLAILFDEQAPRDIDFWNGLLAALQSKRALTAEEVVRLARTPEGVMARNVPMFLQPVFDQAGNAAAGDDEFRLANEVVHKFSQCFLTQRSGQMPLSIRWGLGHLIELRLQNSVYQFNTTGFVSSGDHFGWAGRARRLLEKAAKKRKFSVAELLLGIDQSKGDTDRAVMIWGVLESTLAMDSSQFSGLLEALGEVHADGDPYGVAVDYTGDDEAAVTAVEVRLAQLEMDDVVEHLDNMN